MSAHGLAEATCVALDGAGSLPAEVDRALVVAAIDAVVAGGDVHLAMLGRLASEDVRTKSSRRDLVTQADVESERLIVGRLRAAAPGHAIEAEEETSDALSDAPRWFLDPLDGTVNFVHEIPMFCVSLALYRGEVPVFGVVHAPRIGETFVAAEECGTWLVESDGRARRLHVSETADLGEAILATGFPYRRGELEHSNLENFGRFFYDVRGMRRIGSAALDLAYVAAGRIDGFWELHLSPFDVAAGALLVREAGGVVSDAGGGDAWLRGGQIVASGPGLAAAIRERVIC